MTKMDDDRYVELILVNDEVARASLVRAQSRRRHELVEASEAAHLDQPPLEFAIWSAACEVAGVRYAALFPDDATRLFHTALDLSLAAPDALVVGVLADPVFGVRAKFYVNGEIVGKVGEEPDNELLFDVQPSPPSQIETLAEARLQLRPPHTLPARRLAETRDVASLARLFSLSDELLTAYRALGSTSPSVERLYFSRR